MLIYALLMACSVERGAVKYLRDVNASKIDWTPKITTIAALNTLKATSSKTRTKQEESVYTIVGTYKLMKSEADGDLHVVLESNHKSIIVEVPSPLCVTNAHLPNLATLRNRVKRTPRGSKVSVTGVLFFDFAHGQTGHADNYVELHPVIDFKAVK